MVKKVQARAFLSLLHKASFQLDSLLLQMLGQDLRTFAVLIRFHLREKNVTGSSSVPTSLTCVNPRTSKRSPIKATSKPKKGT